MVETRIHGNPASPYVRKVLAVLELKGVGYRLDPVVPFLGNETFDRLNPLRRIPVLVDDQVTLGDSSVIAQYLEDRFPDPSVYPADIGDRARARFLEEYADTLLGDVAIWRMFHATVLSPGIFGASPDTEGRDRAAAEALPPILDWLEGQVPDSGFLFGPVSIADLSLAPHFANIRWSRATVDWSRWPKTQAWLARVEAGTPLGDLAARAGKLMRVPRAEQLAALPELGWAPAPASLGTAAPRKGPLTVI